jgi:hypothetical protein
MYQPGFCLMEILHKNPIKIADLRVEILTSHLLNTKQWQKTIKQIKGCDVVRLYADGRLSESQAFTFSAVRT